METIGFCTAARDFRSVASKAAERVILPMAMPGCRLPSLEPRRLCLLNPAGKTREEAGGEKEKKENKTRAK